jgi:hypothetical protein
MTSPDTPGVPAIDRAGRLIARYEGALFVLLILVHLLPVWSFRYLPSQDGPAHLNNANALRKYGDPAHPQFARYYVRNTSPDPNYVSHVLLAGLMSVFPMLVAQKVLVSGYIVLLPLAGRYALSAFGGREAKGLSVMFFPFVFNLLFAKGFYNFCYSLGFFLLVVGYFLRHRADFRPKHAAVLFLLTLPLYFSHPVSLAMAYVVIGSMGGWALVRGRGRPWKEFVLSVIALAPTAAMLGWFVVRQGGQASHHLGPGKLAELLLTLNALYSFGSVELAISNCLVLAFAIATIAMLVTKARGRSWGAGDDLLIAVAAFVPVYLMMPNAAAGGSWISTRLTLYPYLLLILWLGARRLSIRAAGALQVVFILAALGIVATHAMAYRKLNPYLEEYCSVAGHVEADSTLLPVLVSEGAVDRAGRPLSPRVKLFRQASGYLAAERDLIDLSNYQARKGYFPLRLRPEMEPAGALGAQEPEDESPAGLPRRLLDDLGKRAGGQVDYILLWDVRRRPDPDSAAVEELTAGYQPVFTSRNGLAKLYQRSDRGQDGRRGDR